MWLKSKKWPHFELVRTITHLLNPESANLDEWCKTPWLRSLLGGGGGGGGGCWSPCQFPILNPNFLPNVFKSEAIAGDRSNRSPLLPISIDNRYCNRFMHLGRRYLLLIAAVTLFTIPTALENVHARIGVGLGVTLASRQLPNLWPGSDHRYSTARCPYYSMKPLRLQ